MSQDLRAAAAALRAQQPQNVGEPRTPPQESGDRLATLSRGPDEELRVNWDRYNDRNFVSLRVWKRQRGQWWPAHGCSVRIRELADFAEAIATAIERAQQQGG